MAVLTAGAAVAGACTEPNPAYHRTADGSPADPDLGTGGRPPGSPDGAPAAEVPGAGGAPGTGGTSPGTGGTSPGTGGVSPGTGGVSPGTGGTSPGTGGVTGTGGAAPATGGTTGTPDAGAPDAVDPRPTQGLTVAFSLEKVPTTMTGADYTETDAYGNTLRTHALTFVTDVPAGAPTGSRSLQFDGTAGYADLTLKVAPANDAPKTIALWFKSTTGTPSPRTLVSLSSRPETTNQGIQLGFDGDKLGGWRYGQNPEFSGTAMRNVWQHGAYTYSGNANGAVHRIYVNGVVVVTSMNKPMSGSKALDHAMIGSYEPPAEMFKGLIKDLRIYDRMLSDAEIMALAKQP